MAKRGVRDRIRRRTARARIGLSDGVVEQLGRYVELLDRWNARMNLTALDTGDAGLDRLIVEPLVAAGHVAVSQGAMVDVGSGAGSPAIPLKLARPGLALLMIEAKARKAAFLRELCRQLELEATEVATERFESLLARPDLHEAHDLLTVRAVRIEGRLLANLQAFVRPGGALFLFRGPSGGDGPPDLRPPLQWSATYPLVESLRSRLVVLKKLPIGGAPPTTYA